MLSARSIKLRTALATIALVAVAQPSLAQPGTWTQSTAGTHNWGTAGNWASLIVADGANNAANFTTTGLTGDIVVTLDTARTIGNLVYDNPSNSFSWSLVGPNALTLSNTTTPSIAVNNANLAATIGVNLAGTQGLNKTGAGTAFLTGDNSGLSGGITVSQGALVLNRTATANPLGANTVTLAGGTLGFGYSGPSKPIALTGWNQDVVRAVGDPTTAPFGTTVGVDNAGATAGAGFYQQGVNTTNPTFGLPTSRLVTSISNPAVTFQLQPYTGNNAVFLPAGIGTAPVPLTLTTPQSFRQLSILSTGGGSGTNSGSTYSVTLSFSDSTTSVYTGGLVTLDWFNNGGVAFGGGVVNNLDRFTRSNGNFDNQAANPRLYQADFNLTAADAAKTITTITFGRTNNTGILNIFAVSGTNAPVATAVQDFSGNNVAVTADSAIHVPATGASIGAVTIGANTLTINGAPGVTGSLATGSLSALSTGGVTVNGNATFAVNAAAVTTGPVTLNGNLNVNMAQMSQSDMTTVMTLNSLNDGGVARTITKAATSGVPNNQAGILNITGVGSLVSGSTIGINSGIVNTSRTAAGSPLGNAGITLNGGTLRIGAQTAPSTALALTGYNQDVLTAVTETTSPFGTTAGIDSNTANGGWSFYERGYPGAVVNTGLPPSANRTIVSPSNPQSTFQLQPYVGNNALYVPNNNAPATVTLSTPQSARYLNILSTGGGGAPTYNLTVNFSDGTSTTYSGMNVPDWFSNPNAFTSFIVGDRLNRASAGSGTFETNNTQTQNPRLYQNDIELSAADAAKTINSITFNKTGGGILNVFGISAGTGTPVAQNFSSNNLTVTANSTISVQNTNGVTIGNLTIGGQTLTVTGASATSLTTGNVTLTGNPTFTNDANASLVTPGVISDGGTARTISKAGAGTLLLNQSNNLVAGTNVNVNAGTLRSTNAGSLGPAANLNMGGGTFSMGANQSVASISGAAGTIAVNGNTLTLTGANDTVYTAALANGTAPGAIVKTGTGALTFSGATTFANYTGSFTVAGGTVASLAPGFLGNQTMTLAGGTLSVAARPFASTGIGGNGLGWTPNGGPTVANNVLTLTTNNANQTRSIWNNVPVPINQNFTVSFQYQAGAGTAGAPADGATFAIQNNGGGSLTALGGGGGGHGYTGINNSVALAFNLFPANTQGGGTTGGIAFETLGVGAGAGSFIPPTPVNITNPAAPGNGGNPINVTLAWDQATSTFNLTMVDSVTNDTYTQGVPIGQDLASIITQNTAFLGFTGATGGNSAAQTIRNFSFNTAGGLTDYTNNVVLTAGTSSTIAVGAQPNFATVNMGTLTGNANSTLNVVPAAGTQANLAYGLGFSGTTLNGPTTIGVANNGNGFGTVTLGTVAGAGSLTKTGPGTLLLNQANTYTGGTTVTSGTLRVTNTTGSATGTGPVAVNGGTLTGNGSLGGAVSINSGGTVSPGLVVGQIGFGAGGALNSGGTYLFEFNSPTPNPGTTNDFISGTGALAIGATAATPFTINIQGVNPSAPGTGPVSYTIATFSGGITGFDPTAFAFIPTGWFVGTPTIAQQVNSLILTFTPVPEPVHLLALCGGVAAAAGWWRRRRPTVSRGA